MALTPAEWAQIERLYHDGRQSIPAIADRFGIATSTIHARRRKYGWPSRTDIAGRSAASSSGEAGDAPTRPDPIHAGNSPTTHPHDAGAPERGTGRGGSRKTLVRRLFRAIDLKLQRLERRMTSGDEPTIADSERETRELAHMIRSFEKVTEVAADIAEPAARAPKRQRGSKPGAAAEPVYVSADAERMRHQIAERLERLHRARAPGK